MKMKSKPDDRSDNAEKIRKSMKNTVENMELAEDMMGKTYNGKTKKDLGEKNERRRNAIDGMRNEIKDEEKYRKQY
jgi:small acid-soluble spore protein (thioredoxin-like protein)